MRKRSRRNPVYYAPPSAFEMAEAGVIQDVILVAVTATALGVGGYLLYQWWLSRQKIPPGGNILDQTIANIFGLPYASEDLGPNPDLMPGSLNPSLPNTSTPWWAPTDIPQTPGQLGV